MADSFISGLTEQTGAGTGHEHIEVSLLSTTVTITASTISALAADNSFNDSANGFVAAGFAVGQRVKVTGFTGNVANNIFAATITALTAAKMTIGGADGNVIVDDAAGESVTISRWVSRRRSLPSLVGRQVLTGSGTYTPTPGTKSIIIEGVGGGGSGGGADAIAGQVAIAQSGSGAGYFRARLTADFSGAAYVVGTGGAAPTAGNNAGNNGTATTFTDTAGVPVVYTAPAGLAGALGVSAAASSFYGSRAGPAAPANGDLKVGGGPSGPGHRLSSTQGYTGNGGDSVLGKGGVGAATFGGNTSMGGAAGTGYGGGGSGGVCEGTGAAVAGGAGANGVLIIYEFG